MIKVLDGLSYASGFQPYMDAVEHEDVLAELQTSWASFEAMLKGLSEDEWNYRYAAKKWSIEEIVGHLIQSELVFNFRAMTIAYEPETASLPGFDQDVYADHLKNSQLSTKQLIELAAATRMQTLNLYHLIPSDLHLKEGVASGNKVTAKALFYLSSGHMRHHHRVLQERYLT